MTRTIDMTPTWREAAQIIALALENGTGKGRDAARAELFRMADMLDQLRAQQAEPIAMIDVIAYDTEDSANALGQGFANEAEAQEYAARMRANGYLAEILPAHEAVTPGDAANIAADHFADPRLSDERDRTADAAAKYTVAAYGENQLTTGYYRTTSQPEWTTDHASADQMTKADAERIADDWNSYASSKGYSHRYRAEPAASTAEKAE